MSDILIGKNEHASVTLQPRYGNRHGMIAGATGIGVGWGYHQADELRAVGARMVIDSFAALPGALAELGGAP